MALEQIRTAQTMAAAAPDSRNRYVDFLRALAISAVVLGHWLMAAVTIDDSGMHAHNVLGIVDATQWLTWVLQVMPLFFLVGGFSNSAGWSRHTDSYATWLRTRLRRLVIPTAPLVATWAVIGLFGPSVGLDPRLARLGSQTALVPLWFLAVYVVMVAATPMTLAIWRRYGGRSAIALAAAALAVDLARVTTFAGLGMANYAFVWGSLYLLGHAWHEGFFADARRGRSLAAVAGSALVVMTLAGPYHVSMVGVPGVEFGNTSPPSAALLALGLTQIGLALAVEGPMRRFLDRPRPWTITVLVNSSIVTLYAWHMTAMVAVIGLMMWLTPGLLAPAAGSGVWWLSRPLWLGLLGIATLPFIATFRRFETGSRRRSPHPGSASAALMATLGVGVSFMAVAMKGISPGHPWWAAAAVLPLITVAFWLTTSRDPADLRELPRR